MRNKHFEKTDYWSEKWVQYIEKYLAAPPRCGIWLNYYFPDKTISFLECAGGSCRDSRYLFESGRQSTGSDFDEKTIHYISRKFPQSKFPIQREDAFSISLNKKSIDVVFHNGFWICFDDDEKIASLLKEQARVSKRFVVALVHNIHNQELVARFTELGSKDDLYNIRFFDTKTLESIVNNSGIKIRSIIFEKFGGPIDRLFSFEKRIPFLSPLVRWVVPRLYRYQPWKKVERIAMVIELDKS